MKKQSTQVDTNVAVYFATDKEESTEKFKSISIPFIEKSLKDETWASLSVYKDLKKSAKEERPAYNRLIKDIFEEKVNLLIVKGELDRLSKDPFVIGKILDSIRVISIFENKQIIDYYELLQIPDHIGTI